MIRKGRIRKLITHLPYQAVVFMLADEKRQHAIGHLISPRWFHPDKILEMTGVCGRQNPILDADLAKKIQTT